MTFQPGQSGNPGGRPKSKPFKECLIVEAEAAANGEECKAYKGSLRWNARQLLEKGDTAAIKEIADRLDGKVTQGISGPDGGPVQIDLTVLGDDELDAFALLCRKLAGVSGDDAEADTSGEGEEA